MCKFIINCFPVTWGLLASIYFYYFPFYFILLSVFKSEGFISSFLPHLPHHTHTFYQKPGSWKQCSPEPAPWSWRWLGRESALPGMPVSGTDPGKSGTVASGLGKGKFCEQKCFVVVFFPRLAVAQEPLRLDLSVTEPWWQEMKATKNAPLVTPRMETAHVETALALPGLTLHVQPGPVQGQQRPHYQKTAVSLRTSDSGPTEVIFAQEVT